MESLSAQIPTYDENEASAYAQQIALMISFPMAMQALIELDLFEMIARAEECGHQMTTAEMAEQLPASAKEKAADMLDRMLRMIASFGVVTCSVNDDGRRVYGLSPVGRYFVRNEDDVSFAQWLCSSTSEKVCLDSWAVLKEAILEGETPFNKAYGMSFFEYSSLHTRLNKVFNLVMLNQTTVVLKKFFQHYKGFENIKQLVDVAGGLGQALTLIVSKYPTIKGINFDLPHVIEHAVHFPGIEHISGDMFERVPGPSEAIFLKWILHNWTDEYCVKLLRSCYNGLLDDGKVIVVEQVVTDEPETTLTSKAVSMLDFMMLTLCPGGKERTRKEFIALANAAGFPTVKFVCHACGYWIMEFFKY